MTDIKSRILSKIDRNLSVYHDKQETLPEGCPDSDFYQIFGALHALKHLKERVTSLNPEDYDTLPIVDEKQTRSITPPASFLNAVLFEIKETLEDKGIDGSAGGGGNSDARPGRREACAAIENFVHRIVYDSEAGRSIGMPRTRSGRK